MTVISPAVSTATARAAPAIAPMLQRKAHPDHDTPPAHFQQGRLFELGFDGSQPHPREEHDPRSAAIA